MLSSKILNATEARKNFYQLLKQVSSGEEIFIENTNTGEKFQIIKNTPKQKKIDKLALLDQVLDGAPTGLPDLNPDQIKKILNTTHDIKLP